MTKSLIWKTDDYSQRGVKIKLQKPVWWLFWEDVFSKQNSKIFQFSKITLPYWIFQKFRLLKKKIHKWRPYILKAFTLFTIVYLLWRLDGGRRIWISAFSHLLSGFKSDREFVVSIQSRDAPSDEDRLEESLRRNWKILTTPPNLRPYFENLFARFLECIWRDGFRLKVL